MTERGENLSRMVATGMEMVLRTPSGALRPSIRRQRAPEVVLTAASTPVWTPNPGVPGLLGPEGLQTRTQGWQKRILELAGLVPEVAGAAALVRSSASRCKLVLKGGTDAGRTAEFQARLDAFDLERAAELVFLSGETYVALPTDAAPYSLSVVELVKTGGKVTIAGPTGQVDLRDPFTRVWKPANRNRWHATSPHHAVVDLVEAMYVHQLADTAVATSRLAGAGILFWPTKRKSIPRTDDGNPAPNSQEELAHRFANAAFESIDNRSKAEAHIPMVVFYDPTEGDFKPELLRIDRDDHADQYALRFGTYRTRYGTAIELPVESTTGMGETNHWSAWAIREDKWREYLSPTLQLIVYELWSSWLLQIDPTWTLEVDGSALTEKPDPSANILRLLQLGYIDPAYAFDQLGLDPRKAREAPEAAEGSSQKQMNGMPDRSPRGGGAQPNYGD